MPLKSKNNNDELWMFQSCRLPLVLRPFEYRKGDERVYKLLGDSYRHGLLRSRASARIYAETQRIRLIKRAGLLHDAKIASAPLSISIGRTEGLQRRWQLEISLRSIAIIPSLEILPGHHSLNDQIVRVNYGRPSNC